MAKRNPELERKSRTRGAAGEKTSRDKKNGTVTVSLRIPIGMLNEIDEALKRRPYRIPRHLWLLEAIHEKLADVPRRKAEVNSIEDRER